MNHIPPRSLPEAGRYVLRLAQNEQDLRAAQRLRYKVFVQELGAGGALVDHEKRLEIDSYDPIFDHLLLIDGTVDPESLDYVVGVYRLLPCDRLGPGQRFYSEDEYDLGPLRASGRKLLELGRSCVHPDHRGGAAMLLLWNGLSDYVTANKIEILFGPASFHGTDIEALAQPLSWLHHHHLAPQELRVRALPSKGETAAGGGRAEMRLLEEADLNRSAAMALMPALIKAYLRLGGMVGDGAFIDRAFNTTDVCLLMDTGRMSARHKDFYMRKKVQN